MPSGEQDKVPTTWSERKEARRNMYLTSTDQVTIQRHGLGRSSRAESANAQCQKCLKPGHWTYECKNEAVYVKRASRTLQMKNPKLRQPFNSEKPPDEAGKLAESNKDASKGAKRSRKHDKSSKRHSRKRRESSSSSSDSDSSSSSDSDSSSGSDSDSDSSSGSSSDSSSSSSSGSESDSGSEKRRRHRSKRSRRE